MIRIVRLRHYPKPDDACCVGVVYEKGDICWSDAASNGEPQFSDGFKFCPYNGEALPQTAEAAIGSLKGAQP